MFDMIRGSFPVNRMCGLWPVWRQQLDTPARRASGSPRLTTKLDKSHLFASQAKRTVATLVTQRTQQRLLSTILGTAACCGNQRIRIFFFFVTWWTLSFLHKIMKIIFTCNLLWPPPYSVQSNGGITDNVSERILKKNIVADRKYYTMSTLVVIQSKSSEPAPTSIIVPICRVAGGAFVFYRSSSGICRCGIAKNAVLKAIHRWIKLKTVSSRNEVLCLHGCNAVTFLDRNGIRVPWRQSNDCTLPATQHHQTRIFTPAYTHTFFTFRATSHWTVSTNLTFHKADTGGRAV